MSPLNDYDLSKPVSRTDRRAVSDYEYDQPMPSEAPVDDRIQLMQQFIELEAKANHLNREQKRLAEQGHKAQAQMREIRERLGQWLGFDDRMAAVQKSSLDADVQRAYGGDR